MNKSKPIYLDRIDEWDHVDIIRLQGNIDREVIPLIDARIDQNRRAGSRIDKNVVVDYAKVLDVDSATIAFHLVRLKEYEAVGFKVGFLNPSIKLRTLLNMFRQHEAFQIYQSEQEALAALNVAPAIL